MTTESRDEMLEANKFLLRSPSPEARARLFCFPFAGAGASSFRRWPTWIGTDTEICPVQLPGKESRFREQAFTSFDEFAQVTSEKIAPLLDRPFAFFGHCMGALLAYALCQELEAKGMQVPFRLFASGSLVPDRGFYGVFKPEMSDEEVFDELRHSVKVGGGELDPDLKDMAVRILRRDMTMCKGYKPEPKDIPCDVTSIAWDKDPDVSLKDASEWGKYSTTRSTLLSGGNYDVVNAPPLLISVIEEDISKKQLGE